LILIAANATVWIMTVESHVKAASALQELLSIIARLRNPQGGCPWDIKQTFDSLKSLLIEEAYEVSDAVAEGDAQVCEELGDLLSLVALYAQIAEEQKRFSFDAVLTGITEKLVRRHPHVFGDVKAASQEEVLKNWEAIKQQERKESGKSKKGLLDGIPRSLPALQRAHEIGERCARVGFDWNKSDEVAEKVREELNEFLEESLEYSAKLATDASDKSPKERLIEEFGDLLFSLAQYSRHLGCDAEEALAAANQKFHRRFQAIEELCEAQRGERSIAGLAPEQMQDLWLQAKKIVG
jgi:ATP diphosphatase